MAATRSPGNERVVLGPVPCTTCGTPLVLTERRAPNAAVLRVMRAHGVPYAPPPRSLVVAATRLPHHCRRCITCGEEHGNDAAYAFWSQLTGVGHYPAPA